VKFAASRNRSKGKALAPQGRILYIGRDPITYPELIDDRNLMNTETRSESRRQIGIWLLTGYLMVVVMIVLGGITRLTQSGLSIVEWDLLMGTLPPLSQADWQTAFDRYRQFPQFKTLNASMSVEEFKSIFWWEYIHRLWGRLMGLVFIVPFVFFLARKKLVGRTAMALLGIFLLGGLQGAIGWYMVKSGLVDVPQVSHYRLTFHLLLALAIGSLLLWQAMRHLRPGEDDAREQRPGLVIFSKMVGSLVLLQIAIGGMVAGLKAGYLYNTFPKMGDEWFPASLWLYDDWWMNFLENGVMVQFLHRLTGYAVVIAVFAFWHRVRRTGAGSIRRLTHSLPLLASIQLLLGILTLLWQVPATMGVLHQTGAVALFSAFVAHHFMLTRKPMNAHARM
jgi:cytochrome c oxidase assembly protein subunit 15